MTTILVQYRLRSIDTTNKHFWHIRVQAKIKIDRKIASPIKFSTQPKESNIKVVPHKKLLDWAI